MSRELAGAAARRTLAHQAFEYSSRGEFVAAMSPFLRSGVERGDRLFAATSRANIAALREELGELGGEIDFRDAADWYRQPYRTLQAYDDYVEEHGGHRTVRVIGEPVWRDRSPAALREWARYESVLNFAFADAPAWIVCPYDTASLPDEIVEHARHAHPEVVGRDGVARRSDAFLPPDRFVQAVASDRDPVPEQASRIEVRGDDLRMVRNRIEEEARRAGLAEDRTEDLVVAVNELTTNGVRHGSEPVVLSTWEDGDELVFQVEDRGEGLADPLSGYQPPAADALSGRGLWIARLLCDAVEMVPAATGFAVRARISVQA